MHGHAGGIVFHKHILFFLTEIVKDAVAKPEADPAEGDSDVAVPPVCNVTSFQGQTDLDEDYIPEMPVEEEDGDDGDDFFQTRKRRKCSSVVRQKWTKLFII